MSVPAFLLCPLTGNLFVNPVITEYGNTFEETALRASLFDPLAKEKYFSCAPNKNVAQAVREYRRTHPLIDAWAAKDASLIRQLVASGEPWCRKFSDLWADLFAETIQETSREELAQILLAVSPPLISLYAACQHGQLAAANQVLHAHPHLYGEGVEYAIRHSSATFLAALLKQGQEESSNSLPPLTEECLLVACLASKEAVLPLLLSAGARPTVHTLLQAVESNSLFAVQVFLPYLDISSAECTSPLGISVINGFLPIASLLVAHGACTKIPGLLHCAGSSEMRKFLLAYIDKDAEYAEHGTPFQWACASGDLQGMTDLHNAGANITFNLATLEEYAPPVIQWFLVHNIPYTQDA